MKIIEYLKGVRAELKHINWPSKKQTISFTIIVIIISIIIAYFLGLLDFIFSNLIKKLI